MASHITSWILIESLKQKCVLSQQWELAGHYARAKLSCKSSSAYLKELIENCNAFELQGKDIHANKTILAVSSSTEQNINHGVLKSDLI